MFRLSICLTDDQEWYWSSIKDLFPWTYFCDFSFVCWGNKPSDQQTVYFPCVTDAIQKLLTGVDKLLFYSCYTYYKAPAVGDGGACTRVCCVCSESRFCHCARKRNRVGAIIIGLDPWARNASRALDISLLNTSSKIVISVRLSCLFAAVPHVTLRQLVGSPPAESWEEEQILPALPEQCVMWVQYKIVLSQTAEFIPLAKPERWSQSLWGTSQWSKSRVLAFFFLFQF